MALDDGEGHAEPTEAFLPWGMPPAQALEEMQGTVLWFGAGAALVLWTAVALLLTSW
jgi:hypothetical protein